MPGRAVFIGRRKTPAPGGGIGRANGKGRAALVAMARAAAGAGTGGTWLRGARDALRESAIKRSSDTTSKQLILRSAA